MFIRTIDTKKIREIIGKLTIPKSTSHKGQNGKVLIIGGSELFHAASLWSAEIASKIVDMVHYLSVEENQTIFTNLKTKFPNGIVIKNESLEHYAKEDDVILIGPGISRDNEKEKKYFLKIVNELFTKFPEKKYVLDAGILQIIDPEILLNLKTKAIITPHIIEFSKLFNVNIKNLKSDEIKKIILIKAREYNCHILLKNITDYIVINNKITEITGGNAGLTKGGTGDVLAGLIAAIYTKNTTLNSTIAGSILLKKSAEDIYLKNNYWFNSSDLIQQIPITFNKLIK